MATYRLLIDHYVGGNVLPAGLIANDGTGLGVTVLPSGWIPTPNVDPLDSSAVLNFYAAGVQFPELIRNTATLSFVSAPATRWIPNPAALAGNPYREFILTGGGAGLPPKQWDEVMTGPLGVFGPSGANHSAGLVPDPGSVAGIRRFLREDATWQNISDVINILNFGGVGDGATDNTTAFNSAVAALGTFGGNIYFPAGVFVFNSAITINYPLGTRYKVMIEGDGNDLSILRFLNNTSGLTVNLNNNSSANNSQSFDSHDITYSQGAVNTGVGLALVELGTNNGSFAAMSNIVRVSFRGSDGYAQTNSWATCLSITNVSNVQLTSTIFQGPAAVGGAGVAIVGTSSVQFATVLNMTDCTFNLLTTGFSYGAFVQGVTMKGCNFSGCTTPILVPASLTGLAQLSINACQFGMFATGNCIVTLSALNALLVTNSLFLLNVASTGGILLTVGSNTVINGNTFQGLSAGAAIIGVAVTANNNLTSINITDNVFTGFNGAGSFPWAIQSGANNVLIDDNQYIASNNGTNAGTGTIPVQKWNNINANYAFTMRNSHGVAGDHGVSIAAGATGATTDSTTVLLGLFNGDNTTLIGSIGRNGVTGVGINSVSGVTGINTATTVMTNNFTANYGWLMGNQHGSAGDHALTIVGGATSATTDSTTNLINFATGNNSNTVGSISRKGVTGLSLNLIDTIQGMTSRIMTIQNNVTAAFGFLIANSGNAAGNNGIALRAGLNAASDSGTVMISMASGDGSNAVGSVTRNAAGVSYNGMVGSTGAGTPTFGTNCPAITPAGVYKWAQTVLSDGSTVYIPTWK